MSGDNTRVQRHRLLIIMITIINTLKIFVWMPPSAQPQLSFITIFLCWDVHLWISMCTFRPLPPRTPSPTSILYLKKHGNFLSHGCNFERLQRPARISQRTMVTYLHVGSTFLSFFIVVIVSEGICC